MKLKLTKLDIAFYIIGFAMMLIIFWVEGALSIRSLVIYGATFTLSALATSLVWNWLLSAHPNPDLLYRLGCAVGFTSCVAALIALHFSAYLFSLITMVLGVGTAIYLWSLSWTERDYKAEKDEIERLKLESFHQEIKQ